MSSIFISYRRSDSQDRTRRLYDRLVAEFGRDKVFIDIESIPLGSDFPTVLSNVLAQCQIVLVVIGPDWATVTEPNGAKRLNNPQDFVRLEVEAALGHEVPVVPVLVGGSVMPDGKKLPEALRPLCRRHAITVGDDPRFDGDVDQLVRGLNRLLSEGLTELPTDATVAASGEDETAVIGCDREFPQIDELIATGSKLVVLAGSAGAGKTTTALELARRHTSPAKYRNILQIDARKEFYELSLIDAVGEAFPEELYRDHNGTPFLTLPFRTQRQIAADLLAKKKATVILDGPGEVVYPRDANAELELARRVAKELAGRSVLVLVTTRNEACWADFNPIRLQGLSPDNAQALFRREFLKSAPATPIGELEARLNHDAAFQEPIRRGLPGHIIEAAREAAVGAAEKKAKPRGVLAIADWIRGGVELLLGDPVLPQPKPPAGRSTGPGPLFAVCVVLLLISTLALVVSYGWGSPMWERMFYELNVRESQIRPLGPWPATRLNPGNGLLIEIVRAVVIIIGALLIVVGRFLGKEAAELLPHFPWSSLGPRRLGLRSLFRIMLLALAAWMCVSSASHHLHNGPRTLWMSRGNPFVQRYLDAADPSELRERQGRADDDKEKMNGEPPGPADPEYGEYERQCLHPYLLYYSYSFVMFVVVAPIVLTVCFYTVCSSLWNHLITQPREIAELQDDADPRAVDNRLRYYEATYVDDIDRYLALLLLLLSSWAYHLWWDQYNLTGTAAGHARSIIMVAVVAWIALFSVLLLTYQALVREAAKRIPDGATADDFRRRHEYFRFFLKTLRGSPYFWLCLVAGGASALWYICAATLQWQ
jgi:hypothetical protein